MIKNIRNYLAELLYVGNDNYDVEFLRLKKENAKLRELLMSIRRKNWEIDELTVIGMDHKPNIVDIGSLQKAS